MTEEVQDPFADKVTAHNPEKMDHAHSKEPPKQIDVVYIIQRLAEIEDELKSRGADDLIDEKDKLRKALKKAMLDAGSVNEYDETSNYEGVLVPQKSDVWNVKKFEKMLSPAQRERYIERLPNRNAVKDGIKSGDLSRGKLEYKGAVTIVPGAPKLYVRERKDETDG